MKTAFLDLPPGMDFSSPQATVTLNDRLRRLADAITAIAEPSSASSAAATAADVNSDLSANCNLTLACTNAFQDIPNASVSLNKNGKWLILGFFDGGCNVAAGAVTGQLVVNGVAQTGLCPIAIPSTATATDSVETTASRGWLYQNTGTNVAKLQAKKNNAGGGASVNTINTTIVAVFLHT